VRHPQPAASPSTPLSQTSVPPNIYAIGDVTQPLVNLTPVAIRRGPTPFADTLFGVKPTAGTIPNVPTAVFLRPVGRHDRA